VKVRDVIQMLENDGWYLVATRGSHRQFKHPFNVDVLQLRASHPTIWREARRTASSNKLRSEEILEMRYAVVIEKATRNYSAYVPDLPGCVATGATVKAAQREIRKAIRFHLKGLREDGASIPEPSAVCDYVQA
jgi:predicted RNase H-like HicB family nuclease